MTFCFPTKESALYQLYTDSTADGIFLKRTAGKTVHLL